MNKYKRALIDLANIAFREDETPEGDDWVRQSLYRKLYALGIVDFEDGCFVYEPKVKE